MTYIEPFFEKGIVDKDKDLFFQKLDAERHEAWLEAGGNKMSYQPDLKEIQTEAKLFIDANVWDGEDRSGSKDTVRQSPDDLQELINEMLDHLANKNMI